MTKLQEKQEAFLSELNERLPRGVHAEYRPSKDMPNVLNVLIGSGNMLIQKFGLIEDKDGTVWYFENFTGGSY
jgi:hypothetical protein